MKILLRLRALLLVTFLLLSITYASASSVQDHRVLSCSPKTLHPGDTLKLTLGPKHGRELGIKDEHGNFFFLVLESSDPRTFELMTPEQFKRARKVEISTNLRAVPAPVTPSKEKRIFDRSGEYTVSVSDNLEADGYTVYYCRVKFVQ